MCCHTESATVGSLLAPSQSSLLQYSLRRIIGRSARTKALGFPCRVIQAPDLLRPKHVKSQKTIIQRHILAPPTVHEVSRQSPLEDTQLFTTRLPTRSLAVALEWDFGRRKEERDI